MHLITFTNVVSLSIILSKINEAASFISTPVLSFWMQLHSDRCCLQLLDFFFQIPGFHQLSFKHYVKTCWLFISLLFSSYNNTGKANLDHCWCCVNLCYPTALPAAYIFVMVCHSFDINYVFATVTVRRECQRQLLPWE